MYNAVWNKVEQLGKKFLITRVALLLVHVRKYTTEMWCFLAYSDSVTHSVDAGKVGAANGSADVNGSPPVLAEVDDHGSFPGEVTVA